MNSESGLVIALGGSAVLVAIVAIVWWLNRTPAGYRRAADPNLPLYSVSLSEMRRRTPAESAQAVARAGTLVDAARPSGQTPATRTLSPPPSTTAASASNGVRTPAAPTPVVSPPVAARVPATEVVTRTANPAIAFAKSTAATVPAPAPATVASARAPARADQPISAHGVPGTLVEGHMLRFSVPQEGTLQFLPGRLEIASGLDAGREIRFVRVPGPDGTEVTFGRSEGPAYRHVQLREGTVSRSHARLRLREGHWHLRNLSATNPVVHNGHMLTDGEEQRLTDGDRIEMGEVVFGFRSR